MKQADISYIKNSLSGLPLMVDEEIMDRFLSTGQIRYHRKGDLIILAGQDSYEPSILLSELIRVFFLSAEGFDVTNLFIFENTFYGSDFLTMKKVSVCSFEALEDCASLVLDRKILHEILKSDIRLLLDYTGMLEQSLNKKILRENSLTAYAQSKSANSLFALELDKRGRAYSVRAFSVHPGLVPDTDLGRDLTPEEVRPQPVKNSQGQIVSDENKVNYKSIEEGAATSVWCATSKQLDGMGGVYCEDCDISIAVSGDSVSPIGVRPWAIDSQLAQRLWELSEELTGIKFKIPTYRL